MRSLIAVIKNFEEVENLNHLIRLNHDRVACYALSNYLFGKYERDTKGSLNFIAHVIPCVANINELSHEVRSLGGEPSIRCTLLGNFFLICMRIRVLCSRNKARTILKCCEQINSMAMNGYTFVRGEGWVSKKLSDLLNNQKSNLKASFNLLMHPEIK